MRADTDQNLAQNLIVYFGGKFLPLREVRLGILPHALHYQRTSRSPTRPRPQPFSFRRALHE